MTYRDIETYPNRRDEQDIPVIVIVGALILLAGIVGFPTVFPESLSTILLTGACAIPVLLILAILSA
jgi:hypothetical protein